MTDSGTTDFPAFAVFEGLETAQALSKAVAVEIIKIWRFIITLSFGIIGFRRGRGRQQSPVQHVRKVHLYGA